MTEGLAGYWYSRFAFERALALLYLIAFLCAANQFVPLLGARGLLPISRFVNAVPFRAAPSLFFYASSDVLRLSVHDPRRAPRNGSLVDSSGDGNIRVTRRPSENAIAHAVKRSWSDDRGVVASSPW